MAVDTPAEDDTIDSDDSSGDVMTILDLKTHWHSTSLIQE